MPPSLPLGRASTVAVGLLLIASNVFAQSPVAAVYTPDAYGVSGLFATSEDKARIHGRDERMRIQSFYEGQEFLYRLTKLLSTNTGTTP